jgi:hypothetical protein
MSGLKAWQKNQILRAFLFVVIFSIKIFLIGTVDNYSYLSVAKTGYI